MMAVPSSLSGLMRYITLNSLPITGQSSMPIQNGVLLFRADCFPRISALLMSTSPAAEMDASIASMNPLRFHMLHSLQLANQAAVVYHIFSFLWDIRHYKIAEQRRCRGSQQMQENRRRE